MLLKQSTLFPVHSFTFLFPLGVCVKTVCVFKWKPVSLTSHKLAFHRLDFGVVVVMHDQWVRPEGLRWREDFGPCSQQGGEAVGLCVPCHARWIARVSAHWVMHSAEERKWIRWQKKPHQSWAPTEAPYSAERFTPPTNHPSLKQLWLCRDFPTLKVWESPTKSAHTWNAEITRTDNQRDLHPPEETLTGQLLLREGVTRWPCGVDTDGWTGQWDSRGHDCRIWEVFFSPN